MWHGVGGRALCQHTQHCYGCSWWAGARLWAAATAKHFAFQPGDTALYPVGGTCDSAAPLHWIIWGLFGVFNVSGEGRAKGCLSPPASWTVCALAAALQLPPAMANSAFTCHSHQDNGLESTRSTGHLCNVPALSPAKELEGCWRQDAASMAHPAFVHMPAHAPHIKAQFRAFSQHTSVWGILLNEFLHVKYANREDSPSSQDHMCPREAQGLGFSSGCYLSHQWVKPLTYVIKHRFHKLQY